MSALVMIDRDPGIDAPDDDSFSRWVNAALQSAGVDLNDEPEVSLRLNDIDEMASLNAAYRGKQGPTNVLSFPAELPDGIDSTLIGDIAICAPVVVREASEQHKSLESHWAHMTVHGVLHLLGFDHIEDHEAEVMERLETEVLAELGFPDPYRTDFDYPDSEQRAPIP